MLELIVGKFCDDNHIIFLKGLFVAFVQAGLPAAMAGLRFGDQILQINGQTVAGWDNDKAHKYLQKADGARIEMAVRDRSLSTRYWFFNFSFQFYLTHKDKFLYPHLDFFIYKMFQNLCHISPPPPPPRQINEDRLKTVGPIFMAFFLNLLHTYMVFIFSMVWSFEQREKFHLIPEILKL